MAHKRVILNFCLVFIRQLVFLLYSIFRLELPDSDGITRDPPLLWACSVMVTWTCNFVTELVDAEFSPSSAGRPACLSTFPCFPSSPSLFPCCSVCVENWKWFNANNFVVIFRKHHFPRCKYPSHRRSTQTMFGSLRRNESCCFGYTRSLFGFRFSLFRSFHFLMRVKLLRYPNRGCSTSDCNIDFSRTPTKLSWRFSKRKSHPFF